MPTLVSINNYYYRRGGAEVVFLEQNRLLEAVGWQVVPFAMQHRNNLPTPWSDYFIDEIEFGEEYSWWDKLRRVPKVIYSLEARRKLAELLDKVDGSIAHAHNIYHHLSPAILSLLKQRGIPTVLTLHDLKIACPAMQMLAHDGICERCKDGKIYNVVAHRCIKGSLGLSSLIFLENAVHRGLGTYQRHVDRFVVPSRFYIDKLVQWGWARERFHYLPNFVDTAVHQPEFRPGKTFLYFGRLGHEKGLATLIKAAAHAQVPLALAGTGPEEAGLRKLAAELGSEVSFLGYLTGAALHNVIRTARASVLPSEWYENAPMSVLESYALGTPLIGASIGGIPELIREEETGLGFASGSVEELAAAMRKMADWSDARVVEMAHNGRRWVESDFTAGRYRERLLTLYREMGASI